jgi:hypothetical protein
MHFVSPKFAEAAGGQDLTKKVKATHPMFVGLALHKEFGYTMKLSAQPWTGAPIADVLRQSVSFPAEGNPP